MGKLQENPAAKAAAVLLLLVSAFLGSLFACRALLLLPMISSSDWQYTPYFQRLLENRQYQVVSSISLSRQLEDPGLTYMDRRQLEEYVAGLAAKKK